MTFEKKKRLKVIESLRLGRADYNTQLMAAELLDDREYHEAQQRRDFYAFCLGMGFLCVLLITLANLFG